MKYLHNQERPSAFRRKWLRKLIVVGILAGIVIIFDSSPFGGNVAFYSKWISCAGVPYERIGVGYMGQGLPYYSRAKVFEPIRQGRPVYYCTPLEAEQAGLSASPDRQEYWYLQTDK